MPDGCIHVEDGRRRFCNKCRQTLWTRFAVALFFKRRRSHASEAMRVKQSAFEAKRLWNNDN
jgi:hypothetical protein